MILHNLGKHYDKSPDLAMTSSELLMSMSRCHICGAKDSEVDVKDLEAVLTNKHSSEGFVPDK